MTKQRRRVPRPEVESLKAQATSDPLYACRVLPSGKVVPTKRAIEAADRHARERSAA